MIKILDLLLVISILLAILYCEYKFHYTSFDIVKFVLAFIFIFILTKAIISYPFKILEYKTLANKLDNVRNEFRNLASTERMYKRFGTDLIQLQLGKLLINPIADPDKGGLLIPKVIALRESVTDQLGFVIPSIRIMDNMDLKDYEYRILFRDILVDSGFVYPGHVIVKKSDFDKLKVELPKDYTESTIAINPIDKDEVNWISENDIENINISKLSAVDIIINHMELLAIKHAEELMTHSDVIKLIEVVKTTNPELTEHILDLLALADLKKIFTNLVKEKISIKDIEYIFEYLNDFARFSKDPDELSEKLRFVLRRQIQQKFMYNNKIYAITFTEAAKEKLINSMPSIDFKEVAQKIKNELNSLDEKISAVLLVDKELRRPLFHYLSQFILNINVISFDELSPNIDIEIIKELNI